MIVPEICPCGTENTTETCCLPIINGEIMANSALLLMRSRYTAYCLQNAHYLYETTHVSQRKYTNKQDILTWAKENTWKKLEIVSFNENSVEFIAYFINKNGKPAKHHEKSSFSKFQEKWYYVDGVFI